MSWGVIAFVASSAFVFYVMAGYPLLVALLAFFPAPEVQIRKNVRSVSILIPVHNGELWIRRKLQSLFAWIIQRSCWRSSSSPMARPTVPRPSSRSMPTRTSILVKVPKGGKPAALNAGMARATGDVIFFTDVRQDVDPICLRCLVECLEDPKVGAVSGQHVILDGETNEEASVGLYWRFEWWVRGKLNRATSMLVVTGCVYAMRRNMVKPIPTDLLIDDCYLPVGALLQGYRIFWDERAKVYDFPTALDAEFSRKARSLAGLIQLVGYYPRLLLPVYKQWGHFLSYKLSRLLLPYALIVVFASSFALPSPLNWITLGPQVLFYGLAALDPLVPERFPLKRASALARTFVVLMLATIAAARIFFVPADQDLETDDQGTPSCFLSKENVRLIKYVFIQDEPYFLPKVLDKYLREFHDSTAGINIQSVAQGKRTVFETAKDLYKLYGFRYFQWKLRQVASYKIKAKLFNDLLGSTRTCYSVKAVARKYGVSVTEQVNVNTEEFRKYLRDAGVEFIVSISGTQMYRKDLLAQTPKGIVNCHGALLPKYRGLMPSFWTLANGETEGGVSVHFVDAKLDNGPILVQKKYRINPQDTLEDIMARSKDLAAEAIVEAVRLVEAGNYELIPNDASQATHFSMPTQDDFKKFVAQGRRLR